MEVYAAKPAHRLSLRQLLFFGRQMDEKRIIKSANYVRTELPVRIAHRIRDLQSLPYVVVKQEWVAKLYWSAFEKLRKYPEIHTQEDNQEFCKFLRIILNEHAPVIPWISLGLSLSSHHLVPEQLDAFMRRMLVSRISRRVLAEHHLALTDGLARQDTSPQRAQVGIIHTALDVKGSVQRCVSLLQERPQGSDANFEALNEMAPTDSPEKPDYRWPEVILDGDLDTKFAYIKEHFEYIVFEILKNAMRHTVLRNGGVGEPAPIRATIVAGPDIMNVRISDQGGGLRSSNTQTPHDDIFSFSHVRNATRLHDERLGALRHLSSTGSGLRATVDEQLDRWKSNPDSGAPPLVGRMGLGLPLSNVYATYFGGSLDLVSMDGWGTDVYLRLPRLATKANEAQQPTLFTLFRKQPETAESVVDISSDPDHDGLSETSSVIDVVGSSPPPPPQQTKRKGKRPRQSSPDHSLSSTAVSSPPSTPPRATPPLRSAPSFTAADLYSSLRHSNSQSVAPPNEDKVRPPRNRTLFATVRKSRSRPVLEYTPSGSEERLPGSQDTPIEIEEEEELEPALPIAKAPVHAFFQPRMQRAKEKNVEGKGKEKRMADFTLAETFGGKCKVGQKQRDERGTDAPWPDAKSAHVMARGDARIETGECAIPRRTAASTSTLPSASEEQTRAWAKSYREHTQDNMIDLSPNRFDPWRCLRQTEPMPVEEIPEDHRKHPAIARLLAPDGAKYVFAPPSRACELLGNEPYVKELANWLKELELRRTNGEEPPVPPKGQPRERKVIVTQVDRRKRRRVENQNEYDPAIAVDDNCIDPGDIELTRWFGNTFFINGPQGSGKSAAVYACAQEFGWSVFEVYPGIGRRGSGANGLASLIGSVGANHTVNGCGDGEVQQSLILLDETDTVFQQDTQFWPTVVGLVRESRRPVVIIANDMFCVPQHELPIHQHCEFQAADPDLMASYLHAQARATGCVGAPSRAQFKALLEGTVAAPRIPEFAVQDIPQHPLPSQLDRSPDLRRVLEDMKFWLPYGTRKTDKVYEESVPRDVREAWAACGKDVIESVGDWSASEVVRESKSKDKNGLFRLWKFAERLSEVDAGLERRWVRQMQAEEVDRFAPSDDDEDRENQLCKPWVPYEQVGIAEYCCDAEIALEVLCLARLALEHSGAGGFARTGLIDRQRWDSRRLEEARAEHQERLTDFLEERIVDASTLLLPRPGLILEIVPVVRTMVAADDAMVASASRVVRGRSVRTSARIGVVQHERYVTLGPRALVAVRKTGFCNVT